MERDLLKKVLSSKEAEIYGRMREYISFKMHNAFSRMYSKDISFEEIDKFRKDYDEARYALGLIDDRPKDYPKIYN